MNNQLIVDPSVIEIQDLLQPQPGLLARIRREYQGRPGALDAALKQLPMTDVTRTHGQDMAGAIDIMQRVAAAPENLQGVLNQGDKTLGEQQMAVTAAAGRLRMEAQLGWLQGMNRATYIRLSNVQQFMSQDRWLKIVGTYPRALGVPADQQFLKIGPDEVQGQFTYGMPDMIVRSDEKMLMAMRELVLAVMKDPELRQRFDVVKLFGVVAQFAGIKNLEDYERELPTATGQVPVPGLPAFAMPGVGGGTPSGALPPSQGPVPPQVMPDEQVLEQVSRGNLVPAA